MKTKVLQIKLWRNSNNSLEWEKSFQLQILNLQKEQIQVKSLKRVLKEMMSLGKIWWRGESKDPKPFTEESATDSTELISASFSSFTPIKARSSPRKLYQETGCVLKSMGHRLRSWDPIPPHGRWNLNVSWHPGTSVTLSREWEDRAMWLFF